MSRRDGCRGLRWLVWYTGLFAFVTAVLLMVLLHYGRSLVQEEDGSRQLYTVLGYMGNVVRALLRGERPPMLSFSLGQGMDVMTTCTYYGYTDPLCLLSAFFRGGSVEYGYALIALLRLYLAGVFAALYIRKVGIQDEWAVGCAAAIYVFDGFGLYFVGKHPFFLNGPLFLPLMLLGVERVLDGRKWLMLTLVTALMLFANFYFAYMTTAISVVYIVVRLFARLRRRGVGRSVGDGFVLLGSYLLGVALAAVVFLPVVLTYVGNSRQGLDGGYSGSLLHYSAYYYRRMIVGLFAPWEDCYNLLNYAPLALFGILGLCTMREARAKGTLAAICLGAIGLCLPAVGSFMNAGGYVVNRWSYAVGLFVALGCAMGLPKLLSMKRVWRRIIAAISLAYAALLVCLAPRDMRISCLTAAALIALFAVLLLWDARKGLKPPRYRMRALTAVFLGISCAAYLLVGYLPNGYGYVYEEMPAGFYEDAASMAAAQYIDSDDACRAGQGRYDDAQSLMFNYMGTSFYWSLVDGNAPKYYQDLYCPTQTAVTHIFGLCGSAPMNTVAAVKYVTQQPDANWVIPYGFQETGTLALPNGKSAVLYENAYALPLGYAYDQTLSKSEYDVLPVEEKLRALTSFAICDGSTLPQRSEPIPAAVEIPYTVAGTENTTIEANWIGAQDRGTIRFAFEAPEDCEVYLIIDGIEVDVETVKTSQRGGILVETEYGLGEGGVSNARNNYYFSRKGLAYCLGHGALHGCTLTFEYALNYRYDDIRIVGIPLSDYRETVAARRAEGMTDVRVSNDRIEGKIAVDGDRVLQIAVPYSRGWSARVDGEARSLFPCGGMYMGLDIGAGEHDIELRYVTPGLVPGAVISAAALLATAVLAIADRRRRRAAASSQKEK